MQHATEPRRRTRLSPDVRSRQLMDHAIAVFAQRGIGRAGHAEIAERANVSVATVFNYFRTREELVDAVLSEVESYLYTMARQSHDSGNSALACIEQFIDRYVDAAYEKGDYNLIALEWGASIRDDVWPRFTLFCERMLEITTRTLLRGEQAGEFKLHMDTQSLAQLLNSFCFPASQMIFKTPQPPREQVKEFMLRASQLALGIH
jgi:TetR/AcrR family transcriptional regulator, hemagglutinin/protease regulatory protein